MKRKRDKRLILARMRNININIEFLILLSPYTRRIFAILFMVDALVWSSEERSRMAIQV